MTVNQTQKNINTEQENVRPQPDPLETGRPKAAVAAPAKGGRSLTGPASNGMEETLEKKNTAPDTGAQGEKKESGEHTPFSPLPPRQRNFRKNVRRKTSRREKQRSEFDQKLISIRRVARVVAGGRRFSFSVAIIIGDKKGSVGVGTGKASDTSLAIEKALRDAKKRLITLSLTNTMSLPHEVEAKYSSAHVKMIPTRAGRGMVAGSSVRNVLELAGARDITAKLISGSKNQVNNAYAAIEALSQFKKKKE